MLLHPNILTVMGLAVDYIFLSQYFFSLSSFFLFGVMNSIIK